jgi:hypothetical protein
LAIDWMIAAEPGWKALFHDDDGDEVGRSRVIGWGSFRRGNSTKIVGIIVDPNDPTQLIPATEASDPYGGEFSRYGFVP